MRERTEGTSTLTFARSLWYAAKVLVAVFVSLFRRPVVPPPGGGAVIPFRVAVVASIAVLVFLIVIFELIRRRRLQERYACYG